MPTTLYSTDSKISNSVHFIYNFFLHICVLFSFPITWPKKKSLAGKKIKHKRRKIYFGHIFRGLSPPCFDNFILDLWWSWSPWSWMQQGRGDWSHHSVQEAKKRKGRSRARNKITIGPQCPISPHPTLNAERTHVLISVL